MEMRETTFSESIFAKSPSASDADTLDALQIAYSRCAARLCRISESREAYKTLSVIFGAGFFLAFSALLVVCCVGVR